VKNARTSGPDFVVLDFETGNGILSRLIVIVADWGHLSSQPARPRRMPRAVLRNLLVSVTRSAWIGGILANDDVACGLT
jgi:hypothetical protein